MRVRLFHWKPAEAEALIEAIMQAGHVVEYDAKHSSETSRSLRTSPPDAFVIDLTRLPSQGREVATYLRGLKATRSVPIVFVDGDADKVEGIRAVLPDASFTSRARLKTTLLSAVKNQPASPVVPTQMMERYAGRPATQKLGIKEGMRVSVIDPPRNFQSVIGPLPENATLVEDDIEGTAVTLWFVENPDTFRSRLRNMARRAGETKLWTLWRKSQPGKLSVVNEQFLRESGLAVGLVDYKVCSVNDTWSGLAFAVKKAQGPSKVKS